MVADFVFEHIQSDAGLDFFAGDSLCFFDEFGCLLCLHESADRCPLFGNKPGLVVQSAVLGHEFRLQSMDLRLEGERKEGRDEGGRREGRTSQTQSDSPTLKKGSIGGEAGLGPRSG